jgi:hypothetical protein
MASSPPPLRKFWLDDAGIIILLNVKLPDTFLPWRQISLRFPPSSGADTVKMTNDEAEDPRRKIDIDFVIWA